MPDRVRRLCPSPITGFRWRSLSAFALVAFVHVPALAQQSGEPGRTAEELFRAACAACHGIDGRGMPASTVGFEVALPDFTDCSFASREPAADWFAIAHSGGPVRAFDRRMPAFGQALAEDEIERTVAHVRGFCSDAAWPRGELNLPRPLITEKAYPEDEAVLTASVGTADDRTMSSQFLYERRFGARNQFEFAVPVVAHAPAGGSWQSGLGDIGIAVKRVLAHSLRRGNILSVTGEMILPTGKETEGLGKGTAVFEPFLTFGQLLPGDRFLQAQAGAEIPKDADLPAETFWRAVIGQSIEQGRFGRTWSPMVELLGSREMESGADTQWDLVPQVQVTLSRRQHIMINGGVRVPLSNRRERRAEIITYLLWDWFDGGLFDGWR